MWTDPQPLINEGNNGVDYVICSFVFVSVKGCAWNVCTGIASAGMQKKLVSQVHLRIGSEMSLYPLASFEFSTSCI